MEAGIFSLPGAWEQFRHRLVWSVSFSVSSGSSSVPSWSLPAFTLACNLCSSDTNFPFDLPAPSGPKQDPSKQMNG